MSRKILVTGGSGFIGTNFIQGLSKNQLEIYNIDLKIPLNKDHEKYWRLCDILDGHGLIEMFRKIQPTEVIHLAARTDTLGTKIEHYSENTEGTANVLEAVNQTPSILRAIFTSTQFVFGPGNLPEHDEDFAPHTIYGQSKVISEQLVRRAKLNCTWTIIRPTNIWGPWHPRYPNEFWKVLKNGLYIHPGDGLVMRSYGYVRNVSFQIEKILEAVPKTVAKNVFYLGEPPLPLITWVNAFAKALTGREARILPRNIIRVLAFVGDGLSAIGIPFPIYTSRFQSMTQNYLTPMEKTIDTLGIPPISLEQGVDETVKWLRSQNSFWE